MVKKIIKSFSESLPPLKHKDWHRNIHHYFTKQAGNVVSSYIKYYTNPGDLVFDPFLGTGVTAIESLALRRRVVGMDISPLACFISSATIQPGTREELDIAFQGLSNRGFEGLPIKDYILSLFEKSDLEVHKIPIPYWYPANVNKRQLIAYSILLHEINGIRNKKVKDVMKLVFSATMARANLTYNLSTTRGENRLGDGGSAIFAQYRYWKPPRKVVLNVWERFEWRFYAIRRAKEYWNRVAGDFLEDPRNYRIIQDSATKASRYIPEESIDYIYTDPPYGAHIEYLDLETMWDAWLGFEVTREQREMEIIEGGSLRKTSVEYDILLKQAIQEMYKVLKPNAWLSIVFAHKDVAYWNALVDAFRNAGFEYKETVVQRTNLSSIHKKKNPLRVLGNQLIINFQKVKKPSAIVQITPPANLESVVLNTAERVIVASDGGATTDQIYEAVIPELIETGNLPEATKRLKTLLPLLEKHFDRDDTNDRWYIKKGATIGDYIPRLQRIRYYIQSVLNKKKKATIDEIHSEVIPNLANGTTPTNPEFMKVLEGIALSDDGKYWQLKPKSQMPPEQLEIDLRPATGRLRRIPGGARSHTEIIYRLAEMGRAGGFGTWIGKREQNETFMGEELIKLSVGSFPIQQLTEEQKSKLPWIDVIWFYKDVPVVAFEVEEHTGIRDALERFSFLLEVNPRNLQSVLVVPERRARKLKKELMHSRYVGHPLYMDQKVKYLFYKDLIREYERIRKTHDTVTASSISRIVHSPQELRE